MNVFRCGQTLKFHGKTVRLWACQELYFSASVWNGRGTFLRGKCKEDCVKLAAAGRMPDRCWKNETLDHVRGGHGPAAHNARIVLKCVCVHTIRTKTFSMFSSRDALLFSECYPRWHLVEFLTWTAIFGPPSLFMSADLRQRAAAPVWIPVHPKAAHTGSIPSRKESNVLCGL